MAASKSSIGGAGAAADALSVNDVETRSDTIGRIPDIDAGEKALMVVVVVAASNVTSALYGILMVAFLSS